MPKHVTRWPFIAVQHTKERSAIHILEEIEGDGMKVPHGQGIRSYDDSSSLLVHIHGDNLLCMYGDWIIFSRNRLGVIWGPTFEVLFEETATYELTDKAKETKAEIDKHQYTQWLTTHNEAKAAYIGYTCFICCTHVDWDQEHFHAEPV